MLEKKFEFAQKHIILTILNHVALGFGLALVLQHYIAGNSFLPVLIAWILIGFSALVHLYEWTR